MKKKIRIGMAQINPMVGNFLKNREKILEYINKAKNKEVDILSFPELAITGYPPEDLLLNQEFIKENKNSLRQIAKEVDTLTVIIGFVDGETSLYNAAAVICDKTIAGIYHKALLPNYGVFDEKRYFKKGEGRTVFDLDGIRFGVNICEDIWYEEGNTQVLAKKGFASVIFNISSSPYHMGKIDERQTMLSERAVNNKVYIAYNNLVGGQDELVFDGGGMVIDPNGKGVTQGPQFTEDLIIADIECEVDRPPKKLSVSDIPTVFLKQTIPEEKIKKENTEKKTLNIYSSKEEEVYKALTLGLRDYTFKNGFKKVVIGLSGGIDSALTACIASDALSSENILGVCMPSVYSSKESVEDSVQLAKNLNIQLQTVPIYSIYEEYNKTLETIFKDQPFDLTEENIQARIRGNILMALSNKFGYLVLTTGNKSEVGVGYCTLYGDMAGGFAVIKDVPKTLVYRLSEYKNRSQASKAIPANIIKKAPSAELRPDQKDSDSLPPYSVLDDILHNYIEENKTIAEIVAIGYKKELVDSIVRLVEKSEYKRRQAPPGIKITPKSFGKDRRIPVTNHFYKAS